MKQRYEVRKGRSIHYHTWKSYTQNTFSMQDDLKHEHNVIVNHWKYSQVFAPGVSSHTLWEGRKAGKEEGRKGGDRKKKNERKKG